MSSNVSTVWLGRVDVKNTLGPMAGGGAVIGGVGDNADKLGGRGFEDGGDGLGEGRDGRGGGDLSIGFDDLATGGGLYDRFENEGGGVFSVGTWLGGGGGFSVDAWLSGGALSGGWLGGGGFRQGRGLDIGGFGAWFGGF